MLPSSGSMSSAPTSSWITPPGPSPNRIGGSAAHVVGGVVLWISPSPAKPAPTNVYQRFPSTGSYASPRPLRLPLGTQLATNLSVPTSYWRIRAPLVVASYAHSVVPGGAWLANAVRDRPAAASAATAVIVNKRATREVATGKRMAIDLLAALTLAIPHPAPFLSASPPNQSA